MPAGQAIRLSLFHKFLLVLVPTFCLMAGTGLFIASQYDNHNEADALAQRVGNLAGRIAGSLERHTASQNPRLAEDFLGTFGTDGAVICAEFLIQPTSTPVASYPPGLGCMHLHVATKTVSLPVGDDGAELHLRYSDAELEQDAKRRAIVTLAITLGALLITVGSASVGFRLIVSRRLRRLKIAMQDFADRRSLTPLSTEGGDELSDITRAYNTLMERERAREAELIHNHQQASEQANRDPLTGLFNRRYYETWAKDCDAALKRLDHAGVIGILDVDHFKRVNDQYGHGVGDEVLVELARRLKQHLRADDLLVRWGGEELLIHIKGNNPAADVAARLLMAISGQPFATTAGLLRITASIGLARIPLQTNNKTVLTLQQSISLADKALYAAKAAGRYRAMCLVALNIATAEALPALECALEHAAADGQLELQMVEGPGFAQ